MIPDGAPPRSSTETERNEARLRRVLLDDLRRRDFSGTLRRDLHDVYRFYLDEERRNRLASMGRLKRFFVTIGWLMREMILRLPPVRRLIFVLALILAALGPRLLEIGWLRFESDLRFWGFLLLLLVLMLELKDKLLARDEIEVARHVQLALLPSQPPEIAGWSIWSFTRPANDVGGDLIDYLRMSDARVGVALGDVAGKGMGAALLMAKLQATLRALGPEETALGRLGERLNSILHRDGLDNRFATLFYAEITPGSPRVRTLCAGHNPPLVVRAGGIETLRPSSLPLGMFPRADYIEDELLMETGDLLVIYSDGLTEAADRNEAEFGTSRLRDALESAHGRPPEEIGRRILAAVNAFIGEQRLHDDLSLVLVRCDPAGI